MNSVKRNSDGTGRGVPRELYASYIVPVLLLLFVGGTIVMLEWFYASSGYSFTAGKPSPRTYRAVSPMKYVDMLVTDRLRGMAEQSVAGVLVRDVGSAERAKNRLAELRDARDVISGNLTDIYPKELLEAFENLSEDRRQTLLLFAGRISTVYFEKLASEDPVAADQSKAVLWTEIDKLALPPGEENLLYQILNEVIDPGYKVDGQLTAAAREMAGASMPPVERSLEVGDIIVERGQVITSQITRLLRLQGYMEDVFPLAQLTIVCFLMLILPLWLEIPARETGGGRPSWSCIVFVIGIGWVCEAAAAHLNTAGAGTLASVTVAYLCMPRRFAFNVCLVGIASGVFLITGLSIYGMLLLLISGFVASMAGFYVFRRIESREDLGYKVFALATFLAIAKVAILWIQGFPVTWETLSFSPLGETWRVCGRFLFFDLATTFLAVSLLPMIEGYIGVLSVLRTRELSHPSGLLLRKLQAEAPGTYHHCLMIGTLAEAVAVDLSMDENLMKMGAYYHDIGKLRRPRFFVENQMGGENIHDSMSPTLSALAIVAHVREGVELANEFGLPKKVKEFITEHHGTTCMTYFYKKALALGENVEREQFCYPGPRPQSRETALLMLLDSSEAAMRAESRNIQTLEDIREIIERVIAIKIAERQLDDVDFTFREVSRIKVALLKAFQSMYHTRKVKEIKEVRA